MEQKGIVMSQKENSRCLILAQVTRGEKTLQEAADEMGVGYRQTKRLKASYEKKGPAGLVHGNRGREPARKISEECRKRILALSQEKYIDFNDVHFSEMLAEREGIQVSRETVRSLRREAAIAPKQKRRVKGHRRRRERKECFGAMLLWDGSVHAWLGPEAPKFTLMSAVDDATGCLLAARFEESETSIAYLRLLDDIASKHGLPLAIYHDRHSALVRNDTNLSLQEQIRGRQFPTQIGAILEELEIRSIPAGSPQAKGRVERPFGTLQDRLIAEMKLEGIKDIHKANEWLQNVFIQRYNNRFGKPPKKEENLFRPLSSRNRKTILSFRYTAVVNNDNTVQLRKRIFDIPPGPARRGYAKARVEVRQRLDGSWFIIYNHHVIAEYPPTLLCSPKKAFSTLRTKGTREWSWLPEEAADD